MRNQQLPCLYFFAGFILHPYSINKNIAFFRPQNFISQNFKKENDKFSFISEEQPLNTYFSFIMQKGNSNYIIYLQNLLEDSGIKHLSQEEFQKNPSQTIAHKQVQKIEVEQSRPSLKTNIKEPLTAPLIQRYSRQMLLKEVAYDGQLKVVNSKVAIIGSGGIGCPLALYLSAAGIGTIGLFDSDFVEVTNLHRQIGHRTDRIGVQKTESLKRSLLGINPHITVNQHPFITVSNANSLDGYDIVIDGSDNPKCRYIVNDYCMKLGKKLLSGACIGWQAQITCYGGDNICYRCLWGNDQKTQGGCSTLGVIGMVPGFVGVLLAIEALKLIIEGKSSLQGKLLTFDGRSCDFKKIALRKKKPECIGCGEHKLNIDTYDYSKYASCSTVNPPSSEVKEVPWDEFLQEKLESQKILDVRPSNIYGIVHFLESENVPFQILKKMTKEEIFDLLKVTDPAAMIPVSCARGITSKLAAEYLNNIGIRAVSISGGMKSYRKEVDQSIPQL